MDPVGLDATLVDLTRPESPSKPQPFPISIDDLPNELLSSILAEIPVSAYQHLVFCRVSRRFLSVACSTYFCAQVSRTRYKELCRLFENASWIMTPGYLVEFASIDVDIEDATNYLCRDRPTIQRGKVRQGLYILDAMRISRKLAPSKMAQNDSFDRGYYYDDIVRRVVSNAYTKHIYEAVPYVLKHILDRFGDTGYIRHLKTLLEKGPDSEFGCAMVFATYKASPSLKISINIVSVKNLVRLYMIGETISPYLLKLREHMYSRSLLRTNS